MPSPYADPNKLAKKLQEEAKKIQEARNEIQARVRETELIIKSLESLGIDTKKLGYNLNQIMESSSKKALDVDSIRNSMEILREEVNNVFKDFIKKIVVPDLKKLALNFSDTNFESEIKKEISRLESEHTLEQIPGLVDGLSKFANDLTKDVKCPEGKSLLSNFRECVDYVINFKRDYFQKIQNLLLEISKYEAFLIKNKVALSTIEELKERARQSYKDLKFKEALESMGKYLDELKEKTTEYLRNSIIELEGKADEASNIGVNTEELSNYLKNIDLKGSIEPMKIQMNLKKINDQLDTLFLDYAIKRLSLLNGKVESIEIGSLKNKYAKELENIRNLLKSQRIEESIKSMEKLEKEINELSKLIDDAKEEIKSYEEFFQKIDIPATKNLRDKFYSLKESEAVDPHEWSEFKLKLDEALNTYYKTKVEEIRKAQDYLKVKFKENLGDGSSTLNAEMSPHSIEELLGIEKEIRENITRKFNLLQNYAKELKLSFNCALREDDLSKLIETYENCNSVFIQAVEGKIQELRSRIQSHVSTLSSINKKYARMMNNINRINELSDRTFAAKLLNELNSKFEVKLNEIYSIISSLLNKNIETTDEENLDGLLSEVYVQYSNELQKRVDDLSSKIRNLKHKALGFSINPGTDDPEKLLNARIQAGLDEIARLSWYKQLVASKSKSGSEDPLKTISENVLLLYYTNKISKETLTNVLCLKETSINGIQDFTPEAILDRAKYDELKRFLNIQNDGTFSEGISKKISNILRENRVDEKLEKIILSELERDPVGTYFKALKEVSKVNGEYLLAEVTNVILTYMSIDFIRNLLIGDVNFSNKYDSLVLKRITQNDYLGAYMGLYEILKDYIQILGLIKLSNNYQTIFISDTKFRENFAKELEELQSSIQRLDLQKMTSLLSELIDKYNRYKSEGATTSVESSWKLARGILSANLFFGGQCKETIADLTELYHHIFENGFADLRNLAELIPKEISLKIGTTEKLGEYMFVEKVNILDEIVRKLTGIAYDSKGALEYFIDKEVTPLYFKMNIDVSKDINEAHANILKYHESLKEKIKSVSIGKNEKLRTFFNSEIDYSSLFLEILTEEIFPEGFKGQLADERKINKRFDELSEKGYNIQDRTLETLQSLSQELKPEIEIIYEKDKGNKAFKLHLTISNKGNWKLYDASVTWLDQDQFIGDIAPGSSISIYYDYINKKDEPLKVTGELLDMAIYEKIITVGKLLTYSRGKADYRQICASCRGSILTGMDMIKCEYCGSYYHFKCAERAKSCKVCGIEFDI